MTRTKTKIQNLMLVVKTLTQLGIASWMNLLEKRLESDYL